ncbi:hypothetical protein IIC45_01000, partial [Patescibacteria group bacterium]|nr:hypothetical protein [Patescibacteria group bacterium]
ILISGAFFISTKASKIIYNLPDNSTASVLFGSGESQISDEPLSETLIDKNENQEEGFVEQSEKPSSTVKQPEVESNSAQATPSSEYITELQEQVESLLEQVNTETTEPVAEESDSDEVFFITPTGIKMDAEGNVIDDSASEGGDTAQVEVTQQAEPGVFITPAGIKIDAEGNIIE